MGRCWRISAVKWDKRWKGSKWHNGPFSIIYGTWSWPFWGKKAAGILREWKNEFLRKTPTKRQLFVSRKPVSQSCRTISACVVVLWVLFSRWWRDPSQSWHIAPCLPLQHFAVLLSDGSVAYGFDFCQPSHPGRREQCQSFIPPSTGLPCAWWIWVTLIIYLWFLHGQLFVLNLYWQILPLLLTIIEQ